MDILKVVDCSIDQSRAQYKMLFSAYQKASEVVFQIKRHGQTDYRGHVYDLSTLTDQVRFRMFVAGRGEDFGECEVCRSEASTVYCHVAQVLDPDILGGYWETMSPLIFGHLNCLKATRECLAVILMDDRARRERLAVEEQHRVEEEERLMAKSQRTWGQRLLDVVAETRDKLDLGHRLTELVTEVKATMGFEYTAELVNRLSDEDPDYKRVAQWLDSDLNEDEWPEDEVDDSESDEESEEEEARPVAKKFKVESKLWTTNELMAEMEALGLKRKAAEEKAEAERLEKEEAEAQLIREQEEREARELIESVMASRSVSLDVADDDEEDEDEFVNWDDTDDDGI